MSGLVEKNNVDGLPKQFVTSLRILFDILDEDGAGYVRLCDIESRWHEEGVRGLPSGVIDTLRKVAPPTGKLSFENFVTGLKYSLLKNTSSNVLSSHVQNGKENKGPPPKPTTSDKPNFAQSQLPIGRQGSHHGPSHRKDSTQNQAQNVQRSRHGQNIVQPSPSSAVKPNNSANTNISQNVELRNQIYNREQIQQAAKHRSNSDVMYRNPSHKTEIRDNMYKNQDANVYNRLQEKPPTNIPINGNKVNYRHQQTRKDEQAKTVFAVSQKPKVQDGHISKNQEVRQSHEIVKMRRNDQSKTVYAVPPRPKSQEIYGTKHEEKQQSRDILQSRQHERPLQQRPQRPPPYNSAVSRLQEHKPPTLPPRDTNGRIMRELKSWQKEHTGMSLPSHNLPTVNSDSKLMEMNRLSADEIYVNIEEIKKHEASKGKSTPGNTNNGPQKTTVRRQNSRRHTLSSGVDYNMIRRAKQLEQERDILLQGLEVVDQTRDWYRRELTRISEKQNYVGKASYSEGTLSVTQERMDFQQARIMEVNTHLKTLMDTAEKGFPAHMNLAVRTSVISPESSITMLKTQNKQLTKEVGDKGDKITKLEKEKASLIRDLFDARSSHKTSYDDTTFM